MDSFQLKNGNSDRGLIVAGVALSLTILATDLMLPLGVAEGVLYMAVVLLGLFHSRQYIIVAAVCGSILTIAGLLLSPSSGGAEMWKVLMNRGLALFVIWATSILCIYYKRAEKNRAVEKHYERLLQLVAVASNQASSFEGAMRICLEAVCKSTQWPLGHLYLVNDYGNLIPTKLWHVEDDEKFKAFLEITEKSIFAPGIGLPGRVLTSKKPAWISNVAEDKNFPRAKLAEEVGLCAGFAFPIMVAVMEFFSHRVEAPNKKLLETMSSVGIQMGRVAERRDSLLQLNKISAGVEQSPLSIVITDIEGKIEYVNPKFCEVTKYNSDEAVGKKPNILKSGAHPPEFYKDQWDTILAGKVWKGEILNKKKNGVLFWESTTIASIKNEGAVLDN